MMKFALVGMAFLLLGGCATFPETVQVAEGTELVPYQTVAAQPEGTKGAQARWGGVIAGVENHKDKTLLEVLHYPMRDNGRPMLNKESVGRFRVYVDGFLDPMVYEQGRSVTLAGEVLGTEQGSVGEHIYVFPTIKAAGHHLWEDVEYVDVTAYNIGPSPFFGAHPFRRGFGRFGLYGWYPGFHNQFLFPQRTRYVIKRQGHRNRNRNNQQNNGGSVSSGGNSSQQNQPSSVSKPMISPRKSASREKQMQSL